MAVLWQLATHGIAVWGPDPGPENVTGMSLYQFTSDANNAAGPKINHRGIINKYVGLSKDLLFFYLENIPCVSREGVFEERTQKY